MNLAHLSKEQVSGFKDFPEHVVVRSLQMAFDRGDTDEGNVTNLQTGAEDAWMASSLGVKPLRRVGQSI